MKVLSLSDQVVDAIYSPRVRERFGDVDLVIGCGDLPYYYLEFLIDALSVPVFYVRGNHANEVEYSERGERTHPWGAVDLHRNTANYLGLLMAGFEGSVRYRRGAYMYTQSEMWWQVFRLVPMMLLNRMLHGRYLDVLVTHAPPWGINDQPDLAHQGFKAFRWFLRVFEPAYHFHGHIHLYSSSALRQSRLGDTQIINTYPYLETVIEPRVALRGMKAMPKGD